MARKDSHLIEERASIVFQYLFDILIESATGSLVLDDSAAVEMLKLVDSSGKLIFRFDNKFNFDSDSKQIIKKAIEMVKGEINGYVKEGLLSEESRQELFSFLNFISEIFEYGKKLKSKNKVSFMVIPLKDGLSPLDYDVKGKNSSFTDRKNQTYYFTAPHAFEFFGKRNAVDSAIYIRALLDYIEEVLKYGDNFTVVSNKKGKIKSEEGTYAARDLDNKLRIQLDRIGDRIVILGIFHKESKGVKSDIDEDVQSEYDRRKEALRAIDKDDEELLKAGEAAYERFRINLNVLIDGDIIMDVDEMRSTLVEAVRKMIELREVQEDKL